jgi:putative oxidoreductase
MEIVFLVGRILFSLVFLANGFAHFAQRENMVGYAQAKGAPAPGITVPLGGVVLVLGGLSVAIGIFPDVGALLLFLFVLPTAFIMHAFWRVEDPQQAQVEQAQFLKNIALAGAALIVFFIYNEEQLAVPLTLLGPLFGPIG